MRSHPGPARVWLAVSQPFGLTCSSEAGGLQSLKNYQQQPRLRRAYHGGWQPRRPPWRSSGAGRGSCSLATVAGVARTARHPKAWRSWLAAAGIKRRVRWHDLRHTCATALLAGWWGRKWTLDEVAKMLGHGSTQVTERYARKLNETLEQAVLATPMLLFPYGTSGGDKALIPLVETSNFVRRRSGVRIPESAQVDRSPRLGPRCGQSDEAEADEFAAAFAPVMFEHLARVAP